MTHCACFNCPCPSCSFQLFFSFDSYLVAVQLIPDGQWNFISKSIKCCTFPFMSVRAHADGHVSSVVVKAAFWVSFLLLLFFVFCIFCIWKIPRFAKNQISVPGATTDELWGRQSKTAFLCLNVMAFCWMFKQISHVSTVMSKRSVALGAVSTNSNDFSKVQPNLWVCNPVQDR